MFSTQVSLHHPVVSRVDRHDTGTLAVTIGQHPTQAVIFFESNEAFEAFIAPVRSFIANEAWDRVHAAEARALAARTA